MIVLSLVDYLGYLTVQRALDLLLDGTARVSALVIAPGEFASLDLFLTILPPVVAVIGRLIHGK